MSPEILGVIVGGLIGMVSSLAGALLNHQLTLRRDKRLEEQEKNKSLKAELTSGLDTVTPAMRIKLIEKILNPSTNIREMQVSLTTEIEEEFQKRYEELLQGDKISRLPHIRWTEETEEEENS